MAIASRACPKASKPSRNPRTADGGDRRRGAALLRRAVSFEVAHTPDGARLISNFLHKIAGLKSDGP